MPSDMIVSPAPPTSISPYAPPSVAPVAVAQPSVPATPMHPNPSYHIDPTLNTLVIEFIGAGGVVENSLPTQQQLGAYQRAVTGPDASPSSQSLNT